MSQTHPLERLRSNDCRRIAVVLRGMWEDGTGYHTRIFDVLMKDWMVMVGESVNTGMPGSTGSWREHIVPCKVILDNCTKMFEDGKSDDEVAFQIERHLLIARITKEERHQLDFGDIKCRD